MKLRAKATQPHVNSRSFSRCRALAQENLSPMKPSKPIITPKFLAVLTLVFNLAAPVLRAQNLNDRVMVEARAKSTSDFKSNKGTPVNTVTQNEKLEIEIRGKPQSPETRAGKWTIYGRDLTNNDIKVLDYGNFAIALVNGKQQLETTSVSITFTREHNVVTKKKKRSTITRVKAEGTKYFGYSVVVFSGKIVVGEVANPINIRKDAGE